MTHPTARAVIFIIAAVIFLGFAGSRADAEYPRIPPYTEQQLADIKEKAAHGDIHAEVTLAFIYYDVPHMLQPTAVNTPADIKKSLEYFKQAAESGDALSQTYVGYIYDRGKGVDQDYKVALKWYQMAAAQGYPAAQDLIGRMYRDGHGVTKNYTQAAEFFTKAALQYDGDANLHLSGLYFTGGPGLPQDYEKAFFWAHFEENPSFSLAGPPPVADDICCEKTDFEGFYYQETPKHLTPEQLKKIKQQIIDFKLPPPTKWSPYRVKITPPPNNLQKQP